MVRLGDFEVTVFTGEDPLPEFDDPDAAETLNEIEGSAAVKYVQATADTEFALKCSVLPAYKDKATNGLIFNFHRGSEAERADNILMLLEDINDNGWCEYWRERYFHTGEQWKSQRLRFGHLQMSDAPTTSPTPDQASAIGSLKVEISEYKINSCDTPDPQQPIEKTESFPETAFKGGLWISRSTSIHLKTRALLELILRESILEMSPSQPSS